MFRPIRSLALAVLALASLPALCADGALAAASAPASSSAGVNCSPRSVQPVQAYVRNLMPQLASVLLASTLVEDVLGRLQDPADRQQAWLAASPEARKRLVETLGREVYVMRDEVRQQVAARLSELPGATTIALDCTSYDRLARRMAQADAKSYLELERMTLDIALSLGAQGVPAWLEMTSEAERNTAREDAVALARNMPAYPFNFEGRAAFNALAVRGLQRSDDARTAAWMSEVRRVMSGPAASRFHKTQEAQELRGLITGSINEVVRMAYDATSRPLLKANFERKAVLVLRALDTPAP